MVVVSDNQPIWRLFLEFLVRYLAKLVGLKVTSDLFPKAAFNTTLLRQLIPSQYRNISLYANVRRNISISCVTAGLPPTITVYAQYAHTSTRTQEKLKARSRVICGRINMQQIMHMQDAVAAGGCSRLGRV